MGRRMKGYLRKAKRQRLPGEEVLEMSLRR